MLIGPPSTGKSTIAKQLVIHQRPAFDEVYVIHEDADHTNEYDDLDPTDIIPEIPPLEFWSELAKADDPKKPPVRRLAIIDDLEYTAANKQRLKNLATLLRYGSSHRGVSVVICHQSWFDLCPLAKKMANVICVWKPRARNELSMIENRAGLEKGQLAELFETVAPGPRDFITVDHTPNSPAPLRLGLWQPLTFDPEMPLPRKQRPRAAALR